MKKSVKEKSSNKGDNKREKIMKKKPTLKRNIMIGMIVVTMATFSSITWAGGDSLALRAIMQEMSQNMQTITKAISREDWELVEKAAPLIANHPQPPLTEKVRILSFIGSEAGEFKNRDKKTHQAALRLAEDAKKQDGVAVIASFATLQNSCLSCHQTFKQPFKEHFYGEK